MSNIVWKPTLKISQFNQINCMNVQRKTTQNVQLIMPVFQHNVEFSYFYTQNKLLIHSCLQNVREVFSVKQRRKNSKFSCYLSTMLNIWDFYLSKGFFYSLDLRWVFAMPDSLWSLYALVYKTESYKATRVQGLKSYFKTSVFFLRCEYYTNDAQKKGNELWWQLSAVRGSSPNCMPWGCVEPRIDFEPTNHMTLKTMRQLFTTGGVPAGTPGRKKQEGSPGEVWNVIRLHP